MTTSCIETAENHDQPLWTAFLGIKGAYDNVKQEWLWEVLWNEGLKMETIKLLWDSYKNNKVIVTSGGWGDRLLRKQNYKWDSERVHTLPYVVHDLFVGDGENPRAVWAWLWFKGILKVH